MPELLSTSTAVQRPGWITLATDLRGSDRNGREHLIKRVEIEAQAYIPDVYVRLDRDVGEDELYDDEAFVAFVNSTLKALGYVGRPFGRAELGMQGRNFIVLEPPRAFAQFVAHRFGWVDLNYCARAL